MALALAIIAFVGAVTAASWWKLSVGGYTGLDLAILHQVFWNTARGAGFAQSIHSHSYLGDHAELVIGALAQIYRLWQDPRMLLMLQAVALGLAAIPLALIARKRLAGTGVPTWAPLAVAVAWLLNPSVQSIGLFEFHVLPFALLPLLFAALAYDEDRLWPFLAWCAAAVLVREDVAVAVAGFGLLALVERRRRAWVAAPALIGAVGLIAMTAVVRAYAPTGYKFSVYYAWLNDASPGTVIAHLFSLPHAELAIGFLLPVFFLPLAAPKRLILAALPLAATVLTAAGGGALTLQTHYATLFLPAVFLAAIDGLRATPALLDRLAGRGPRFSPAHVLVVMLIASVYAAIAFGPFPGIVRRSVLHTAPDDEERRALQEILAHVPAEASVAASYRPLALLSGRSGLYSLHYHYLGLTQFGRAPYAVPDDTRFVLLDRRDPLTYAVQYDEVGWASPGLIDGPARLMHLVESASTIARAGPYLLFDRTIPAPKAPSPTEPRTSEPGSEVPRSLEPGSEVRGSWYGLDDILSPVALPSNDR